ncbi:MAG: hypothetical protein KC912_16435 [Proteobacteria bacterium]|nr:hypothetical protein [Pseudomonadota bacterium]
MAWDEIRLSKFQEKRSGTWWKVLVGFAMGGALGFTAGQRTATPPPPDLPTEPVVEVLTSDKPKVPRDPLLAALHASGGVQTCFAKHGSRSAEAKHEAIQFALVIHTDGTVESSSVMAPGRLDLQSCLIRASGRVRFPPQREKREVGLHTEMGSWFR